MSDLAVEAGGANALAVGNVDEATKATLRTSRRDAGDVTIFYFCPSDAVDGSLPIS